MAGRRIRYLLIALVVVLAGLAGPVAYGGTPPPRVPGGSHTVTLVTGDRIRVDAGPRATVLQTAPGTRAFTMLRDGTSLFVIPDQALPLLAEGSLDRRLFDVTGLVSQGYDDKSSDSLPLIIEGGAGLAAPAAATVTRTLPAIGAVAAKVTKSQTERFWGAQAHALRASTRQHIWLDAQVRGSLDQSVPRIHAPAAWARGLDGHGVRVAVLDSGIDESHPDLAGKVKAEANFTDEKDTDDHVGHGTHVASIVAGTGAGSGGRYRGVAPGADLLNGKVLELQIVEPGIPVGAGQESWIIAGMQWAVDQGADIVNLSLGNPQRDGNDPLSQAVNDLTARTGTLFVAAAGNSGPNHFTIDSPAAADSALAVGSIDRDDAISSFSSLGPRLVDGAVKPDVTAPGQGIVAARAKNGRIGSPVNDLYTALSGTSMATPHVAGAAALLRQQHPAWRAGELRAALTSTAEFNPAFGVYEQGGGLIDLDRATRQGVRTEESVLNLGTSTAAKTLTYRNDTAAAVTLSLSATATLQSGDPAPPGTLTVQPATLTVPAGGSAQAQVHADTGAGPSGAYSGRVVAADGDLSLGTPVGFAKRGEDVDISFRAVDRRGDPAEASLILRTPRAPNTFLFVPVPAGGTYTVRFAPGDYAMLGYVRTPDVSGRADAELTVVADPEFTVSGADRTVTLDARQGRRLGVQVPRDTDLNGLTVGMQVTRPELTLPMQESLLFARGATYGTIPAVPMSILPFDPPRHGHGDIDSYWSLVSPRVRASVGHAPLPVALMDASARVDGSRDLPVVDAGAGRDEDYAGRDVTGALVLVRETAGLTYGAQAATAQGHGAAALLISSALPGAFHGKAPADIPVLSVERDDGDRLRARLATGPVKVTLSGSSVATYQYDLAFREHDGLRSNLVYHPGPLATVVSGYHADGAQRFFGGRFPAASAVCGYCALDAREFEDWHGGMTRTEYVTPGMAWQESLLQQGVIFWDAVRSYAPGRTTTSWGRAPVAPGVPRTVASVRDGDRLHLRLAAYTDGDPAHTSDGFFGFGRFTSLSRDGVDLGPCSSLGTLQCDVDAPQTRATYTLTANFPAISDTGAVPPSTTTWRFSTAPGEAVLPLIDLDYDLPVSIGNTLRAGEPATFVIGARHQAGARAGAIGAVGVQVSYDDGQSWVSLPTERRGAGSYAVHVRQPATPGYVALRVTASDAQGNSIVQEVRRAYRITP